MFDLTTYVKKWRIRQLKTVFSTLDTLCLPSHLILVTTIKPLVVYKNDKYELCLPSHLIFVTTIKTAGCVKNMSYACHLTSPP